MKKTLLALLLFIPSLPIFSHDKCMKEIKGYKIVKDTTFSFSLNKQKACFFAFYTTNPHPMDDIQGNGNLGDTIWYGYYKMNTPLQINEFPKPSEDSWTHICSIEAISFYPMHGNKKRDVTIIGGCDKQNAINYNYPLVFSWKNGKYVLDENVYLNLSGAIALTVSDIQKYIKNPLSYERLSRY